MKEMEQRLFAEISEDDPDILEVWMDGEVICSFSEYDISADGIEAVSSLVEKIAQNL